MARPFRAAPSVPASDGENPLSAWKKTIVFGCIHFISQISLYALGFALGPGMTSRTVLGISLYDAAAVITFPFVFLAEKYQWSGLGIGAFFLNSVAWACVFYGILAATRKLARAGD